MRLRTTLKLLFPVALFSFIYGAYLFNEELWGRKWQPADAILPNNVKYYGALKDGLLEGPGELVGADGSHFIGNFQRGLIHGEGEWRTSDMVYKGEFARGMFHGTGTLEYHTGMIYSGEFHNNRMHGKGRMQWPNGDTFEGEFADDQMKEGVFREKSGGVYEGAFAGGFYEGKGIYKSARDDQYDGDFVAGGFSGKGRIERADGSVYEGDVSNWTSHGEGVLIDAEGNVYTGSFEHGFYHGPGELSLKNPADGEPRVLSGNWIYGELESATEERVAARALQVEDLLYSQPALLETEISTLVDQVPNKIDFYFIGVAGDGAQEIFFRELHYVAEQLTQQLDIAGRQILLANNRQSTKTYPLATRVSLARAVEATANKMDLGEDILLLYLTSHGTEDHQFHIAMPGIQLPAIGKDDLTAILDKSGVRWRVVIISACYSGGFIPGLQNENTLVITASRADRQSFGCDDRNDLTYFARAYFKESLTPQMDFIAAFDKAKSLINEWEQKDFPEEARSEPQMFVGEAIRQHLQGWAQQLGTPSMAAP